MLSVKETTPYNLKIGNTYKIKGSLYEPAQNTNPGCFDYRKYLLNDNIRAVFYVDSFLDIIPDPVSIDSFTKVSSLVNLFTQQ